MIREIIDYLKMIQFDNSLIMALVAINMTVIGLTSLADKKTVIGIDYGEFLIKKFKYLNIRMYHWLILFAVINIVSLFIMFISDYKIRFGIFVILIFSVIFAIIYFFNFILIENKGVIKQIYISEILGLYCSSNDTDHFKIDKIVRMNSGTRTTKVLSTNVISYFNTYNADSKNAFNQVFGSGSVIYSNDKSIIKVIKINHNYIEKYRYRESDYNKNIKEISFEFFQLFRFVENQSNWALAILESLNGFYNQYKKYNIYRLYNFARLTAQINVFGVSEDIFKYKFLFHYRYYWYNTVDKNKEKDKEKDNIENDEEHIREIEEEIIRDLFSYISKTISRNKNNEYIDMVNTILKEIILEGKYNGVLHIQEVLEIICEIAIKTKCDELQIIIEKNIGEYKTKSNKINNSINILGLKESVMKVYQSISQEEIEKERIFVR